jgi:hypothetical protein
MSYLVETPTLPSTFNLPDEATLRVHRKSAHVSLETVCVQTQSCNELLISLSRVEIFCLFSLVCLIL